MSQITKRYDPHPNLKEYVKCYWVLSDSCSHSHNSGFSRNLDAGLELIFNFAGPVTCKVEGYNPTCFSGDFMVGSLAKEIEFQLAAPAFLFAVQFTPYGLYPFLSMPPADLSDFCFEIEEVWELKGLGLAKLMHSVDPAPENLIQTFEDFFSDRMQSFRHHSLNVEKAVNIIRFHKGQISVESIAKQLELSCRHLERKFSERIGITPKQLCRVFRIKNAIKQLKTTDSSFPSIESGYFDQSHFIHEFKHFTGKSPSAYFK